MKTSFNITLIAVVLLSTFNMYAQNINPPSSANKISLNDLNMLVGDWEGSLTYLDYSTNKPYTMPANLIVEHGKKETELILFNAFPNEPKANNKDNIVISKDGTLLNKTTVKSRKRLPNRQIQITSEHIGKDDNKKALIKYIYLLGNDQLVIRKEVQFNSSNDWIQRNEYSYVRKTKAAN